MCGLDAPLTPITNLGWWFCSSFAVSLASASASPFFCAFSHVGSTLCLCTSFCTLYSSLEPHWVLQGHAYCSPLAPNAVLFLPGLMHMLAMCTFIGRPEPERSHVASLFLTLSERARGPITESEAPHTVQLRKISGILCLMYTTRTNDPEKTIR